MNDHLAALQQAKAEAIRLSVEFGPKLLKATIILIVGFLISRWLARGAQRWLNRLDMEPPVRTLMVRIVYIFVMILFIFLAAQNLGFELLPLLAGVGVAGAGVALAMQGPLSNLAAGLTIIFTRPFRVGEYVSMVGVEGRVENIELFTTTLSHADLSRIVIPNRKIVGEVLHNYGKIRQLDVMVGVAYSTDLNAALAAVNDVIARSPHALKEPAPVIRVAMLGDSSINLAIKPWVKVPDFGPATGEINKAVVEEFRARQISIPFPQREVRLLNDQEPPVESPLVSVPGS